jgi:DNA-binding LacI/PurR family transcriptional regulator
MTSPEVSPPEPPTLADVARRAGVNKVTASIALGGGGSGNTRISEATRQRILRAAEELQYQPNALARSLRRRRSNMIGFYMGAFLDTRNPFLSEVVSGLYLGCEENGRDFLMHGTFRGESIDEIVAELLNGKVDGLVLHVGSDHPLLPRLAASRLPVVALANPADGMASVTVDDDAGSRLLVEHLAERGHKHILYARSPFCLTSVERRYAAFEQAANERNMTVASIPAHANVSGLDALLDALSPLGSGADPTPARADRPTALVCWNDEIGYPIVDRLRILGVRIPEDLAVAGFDGWSSVLPTAYRLTTITAPWREAARQAVGILARSAGKPDTTDHVLPVALRIGDTT